MDNKFVGLEDEIELRRMIRNVYKNGGIKEVYIVMGELGRSLEIVTELALELLDEETKKKEGK